MQNLTIQEIENVAGGKLSWSGFNDALGSGMVTGGIAAGVASGGAAVVPGAVGGGLGNAAWYTLTNW